MQKTGGRRNYGGGGSIDGARPEASSLALGPRFFAIYSLKARPPSSGEASRSSARLETAKETSVHAAEGGVSAYEPVPPTGLVEPGLTCERHLCRGLHFAGE